MKRSNCNIKKNRKSLVRHGANCVLSMTMTLLVGIASTNAALPLKTVGVPDVNLLGLLDRQGGATGNTVANWGEPITKPNMRIELQQFGKAAFYDMQVGGDGVQACASCHFTAGSDNRKINQMSPGLRRTAGGANNQFETPDTTHQLIMSVPPGGPNGTLSVLDFGGVSRGLPVSEDAVIVAGGTPDDPLDGTPGLAVPLSELAGIAAVDVNDVVSSQGPRSVLFQGLHCLDALTQPISCDNPLALSFPAPDAGNSLSPGRQDLGTLDAADPGFDDAQGGPGGGPSVFFNGFTLPATGIPNTARHVEPRNTQTVLNAAYNQRSFHDGRADMFFNGVNTLGFRDPNASLWVYNEGLELLERERFNYPFSSLASQAMGPIEAVMEMVGHLEDGSGRPNREMGKKMVGATPLYNQNIACDDSLLGNDPVAGANLLHAGDATGGADFLGTCSTDRRGLDTTYSDMIEMIFDQRFWGDGSGGEVCLTAPSFDTVAAPSACGIGSANRTLKELNFAMFFAWGIQAYEMTLFTGETISDLLAGGVIPPGTIITNGTGRKAKVVDLGSPFPANGNRAGGLVNVGLTLEECIELVAQNNSAAQELVATDMCTLKFAAFIHPNAEAGTEAGLATHQPTAVQGGPVPAGAAIGGCPLETEAAGLFNYGDACRNAQATLLNIDEGDGRFNAGATGCVICHFNPERTGSTVSATTGFGAPPPEPFIPPGVLRREEPPALMERMIKFDGGIAVYDAGFYNISVRPTPEDLAIGAPINNGDGNIPLSLAELKKRIAAGVAGTNFDPSAIADIGATINNLTGPGELQLPTSMVANGVGVDDFTPITFDLKLACGLGLVGNNVGNGEPNNDPNVNCDPNVLPDEFVLRNGAIKAQGLRMSRYTGPHFHNGGKKNLRQVFDFYKNIGDLVNPTFGFPNLNLANLDAGLRIVGLDPGRESAVVELLETGMTDFNAAYNQGKFDHPELCVPNGHDPGTGETILAGIPAVGQGGHLVRLQTFEEGLVGEPAGTHAHDFSDNCTIPGMTAPVPGTASAVDVPPVPLL